jgi:hypothetical protein
VAVASLHPVSWRQTGAADRQATGSRAERILTIQNLCVTVTSPDGNSPKQLAEFGFVVIVSGGPAELELISRLVVSPKSRLPLASVGLLLIH